MLTCILNKRLPQVIILAFSVNNCWQSQRELQSCKHTLFTRNLPDWLSKDSNSRGVFVFMPTLVEFVSVHHWYCCCEPSQSRYRLSRLTSMKQRLVCLTNISSVKDLKPTKIFWDCEWMNYFSKLDLKTEKIWTSYFYNMPMFL